jgi:hypothetical protein
MASITYSSLTPGNRRRMVAASSVNYQTSSLAALLKFDADGLEVVFCHGCLPWCREAAPRRTVGGNSTERNAASLLSPGQ